MRVFPDLRTARRLALAVARGRFRDQGATARGPLGLGTEFELIRDYEPDDDIRQVNWRATARLGRPMSNQYRLEQDRDLLLLLDAGRLSAAPLGQPSTTVLDAGLDAAAALAFVADELGDRTGAVAFDDEVRDRAPAAPRRRPARRARAVRPRAAPASTATTSSPSGARRAPSARSWSSSATCSRRPPRARSSRAVPGAHAAATR